MKEYTFIVQVDEYITRPVSVIADSYEEAALKCCEEYGDEFDLTGVKPITKNKDGNHNNQ